ncbi:MAG: N-acetylmuramidase domain-containing protein, partial [Terricaulis sp.]
MKKTTRRSLIAAGAVGATLSATISWPAIADETPPDGSQIQPTDFLASLRATSVTPLTRDNFIELAASLQVEAAALEAIASTESGGVTGFDDNGRPRVLFEQHIFSRLTNH